MRSPVRANVGADQPAASADHVGAELPDYCFIRQVIGIRGGAVIAPRRFAVREQIASTVAADVAQGHRREGLASL